MPAVATHRHERWRPGVDLYLVVVVLALCAPFLREWSTQPASRYLFTVAVVDHQSQQLDPYRESLGLDFALVKGHAYSDKAPYQPLLAVPVYGLYRALGGEPFPEHVDAATVGHRADIGLWLVTLMSSVLPAALLIVLVRRYVARQFPADATKVALALMCGTVMLPFSSLLFGHVLAATVAFAAWAVLRRDGPTPWSLFCGGLLLGAGLGVEYPQVFVAGVVGIYCLFAHRARAVFVAGGGLVATAPLLIFNQVTFGGPFTTAYQGYLPNFQGGGAFGVYNLVTPDLHEFALALVGDRGLLSLTPIMVMALLGCVAAIRGKGRSRADAIVALILFGLYLLATTGKDGYGGSSAGPRYLIPVIPFFAVPLAEAWRRWRPMAVFTAALSALWMVLATLTDPLYQDGGIASIDWLRKAVAGEFDKSIPGALIASPAILLMVGVAGVSAWRALAADGERREPRAVGDDPLLTTSG